MPENKAELSVSESVFGPILEKTGQPAQLNNMIAKSLGGLFDLVTRHNGRVLRIQQTRAADPNNSEVLDSIWTNAANAKTAPSEILTVEEEYDALVAEMEAKLSTLRDWAKTQIKPPLSDAELEAERKAANEEAKLIEDEKGRAKAFAEMADQMLTIAGHPVENGILSMIPEVESMKGTRGRKATAGTSGDKKIYRTRLDAVSMNGVLAEKGGKSNFIVAAEKLNKDWNAAKFPQNAVTDEELERAMYVSKSVEFRDSGSLDEKLSFEFTKDIQVQNPNDNSSHTEQQKVKFDVVRNVRKDLKKDDVESTTEIATDAKSEDVKASDEKASDETVKVSEPTVESKPVAPVNAKQAAMQAKQAGK